MRPAERTALTRRFSSVRTLTLSVAACSPAVLCSVYVETIVFCAVAHMTKKRFVASVLRCAGGAATKQTWPCRPPSVLRLGRKDVSGAPDRANNAGVVGIGLDLAADARDAHVDGAIEGVGVSGVGEIEKALAGHHPLRVLGE